MSETRRRKSRVLEYFESHQTKPESAEAGNEPEGSDPFEGLDQSFGLLSNGKESSNG